MFGINMFQKFESTESFDSEISSVENKSKFKENIELIQSHRSIKSIEIQMETLQAQCKNVENNLTEVNELLQKEREDHGKVFLGVIIEYLNCDFYKTKIDVYLDKLKQEFMDERHNLSELKSKYNSYQETNKALEEQIRDLKVI